MINTLSAPYNTHSKTHKHTTCHTKCNTRPLNCPNTSIHSVLLTVQLTRWLVAQILPLPDNLTFPPSEIRWKLRRWCPLDLPEWSTYTRHCFPGLQHLRQCQGSHHWGNQSWIWAHWSPSGYHHTCPPLSVTQEKSREGRGRVRMRGEQTHSFWIISKPLLKVHIG